jgi:thymidylate kinase
MSDIAVTLAISSDSWEERMAKRKLTKAERAERDARHERMLANAQRTRELAEQAQARLDASRPRD